MAHQRDALPLEMQHHAANDARPLNDGVLHASRIRRGAAVARQLDAQDAQMAGQQWNQTCKAAHIVHPAVNGEQRTHLTAAVPAAGDAAPRRAYVKVNKLPGGLRNALRLARDSSNEFSTSLTSLLSIVAPFGLLVPQQLNDTYQPLPLSLCLCLGRGLQMLET